jgi:hypothetical protein
LTSGLDAEVFHGIQQKRYNSANSDEKGEELENYHLLNIFFHLDREVKETTCMLRPCSLFHSILVRKQSFFWLDFQIYRWFGMLMNYVFSESMPLFDR